LTPPPELVVAPAGYHLTALTVPSATHNTARKEETNTVIFVIFLF